MEYERNEKITFKPLKKPKKKTINQSMNKKIVKKVRSKPCTKKKNERKRNVVIRKTKTGATINNPHSYFPIRSRLQEEELKL